MTAVKLHSSLKNRHALLKGLAHFSIITTMHLTAHKSVVKR